MALWVSYVRETFHGLGFTPNLKLLIAMLVRIMNIEFEGSSQRISWGRSYQRNSISSHPLISKNIFLIEVTLFINVSLERYALCG